MAFPTSPTNGDTHVQYGTTYTYDGIKWTAQAVTPSTLIASSATAPTNPPNGMIWFDSTNTKVKSYDGTTWNEVVTAQFDGQVKADVGIGATYTQSVTGTVELDFTQYENFVLTLTGNLTLTNPGTTAALTESVGQSGFFAFKQDGTGGRTVSLGTEFKTAGGAGLTLSTAANTTDFVPYTVIADGQILLGTPQLAFA